MTDDLMSPIVNLNGTSRAELVLQRQSMMAALERTMVELSAMRPHGRDSQTAPDPAAHYERNLSIWSARFNLLDKLRKELAEEELAIQNETT